MVKVLLVDDDALVRAGLRMILSSADDLEIVAEAEDGAAAITAAATHRPDVVLMDIRMPGVDGIAATSTLRRNAGSNANANSNGSAPQVIVLTTFDADDYVLRALRAGASGFLLKDTAPAEIVAAVRLVHAGEAMLSPAVTRTLIGHVAGGGTDPSADDRRDRARRRIAELTPREREVALAVGRGDSNADIAATLFMSEATVKAHVSRLLAKLDAANRVQVAIAVHNAGLGRERPYM